MSATIKMVEYHSERDLYVLINLAPQHHLVGLIA